MLSIKNISFSIGNTAILNNISFDVKRGEMLVIVGANGAGKSTLLKIVSGEINSSAGEVEIQSKKLNRWKHKELAQFRAVLKQQTTLVMPFLAKEVVMMGRYPHFNDKENGIDHTIVNNTLSKTGIKHLEDRNYLTLSGGEQQRVQLARVFAQIWHSQDYDNRYLLLDEPVNSLDIQHQYNTLKLAREYAREGGNCVIAVLHDLNMASQYADKILILKQGETTAYGTPAEVIKEEIISKAFDFSLQVIHHPGCSHPIVMAATKNNIPEEIITKTIYNGSKEKIEN